MSAAASQELYGSDISRLSPLAARFARRDQLKWIIAFTAAVGALMAIIDTSIVNVALPDIQGNLGATLTEVGWVSTSYTCANVVLIPLTAWLNNRFGRKNYLVFSLVGFTLSSALCGMATTLPMLIAARVLQGLTGGGLMAKAQAIMFESFPHSQQAAAQAVFGIVMIAGPALGPVLGGYLTDTVGWHWIFFINLPVGALAIALAVVFLPRDNPDEIEHGRVDWTGIILLTIGLACLQTVLEEGYDKDWFSSRFITGMSIAAALGIVLFIWRELTTDKPAVDLRVLKHHSLAAGSLYSLVLGAGLFGILFSVPIFAQNNLRFTALQSGLLQTPAAVGSAIMMIIMGRLARKGDARLYIVIGAIITAAAGFLLSSINPDTSARSLSTALIVRNIGNVFIFLPLSLATIGPLPRNQITSGTGLFNLTRQLGGSIGIAIITTALSKREAVHRAILVEKITPYDPATLARLHAYENLFRSHGADPVHAHQQALALLDRVVMNQAAILSFAEIFRAVGIAFVLTLPLIFFLGKGRPAISTNSK